MRTEKIVTFTKKYSSNNNNNYTTMYNEWKALLVENLNHSSFCGNEKLGLES